MATNSRRPAPSRSKASGGPARVTGARAAHAASGAARGIGRLICFTLAAAGGLQIAATALPAARTWMESLEGRFRQASGQSAPARRTPARSDSNQSHRTKRGGSRSARPVAEREVRTAPTRSGARETVTAESARSPQTESHPESRAATTSANRPSERTRTETSLESKAEVRVSAAEPRETPAAPTPQTSPAAVSDREIVRGPSGRDEVALTFDAGSDHRPVARILSVLNGERFTSTFFLTGGWTRAHPDAARRIAAAGNELGNHSWDHPPFSRLSDADIRDQLRRTEAEIVQVTGRSSKPYFRPPLGDRDARVRRIVSEEGYSTVYWTLDSRDSVVKGITSDQIRDRVLSRVGPGSIVLLHCGSQASADALPEILVGLKQRGLNPVTLSRLLGR